MKLSISNFSKIQKADITLNSITVIAGLNDTGKTTIGKLLYAYTKTFNSIEKRTERLLNNRVGVIIAHYTSIDDDEFKALFYNKEDILKNEFIALKGIDKSNQAIVKEELMKIISRIPEPKRHNYRSIITNIDNISEEISEIYTISSDELEIGILEENLTFEFEGQLNNLYKQSQENCVIEILSSDDKNILTSEIRGNRVFSLKRNCNISNTSLFVDDPFILNNDRMFDTSGDHKGDLYAALYKKNDVVHKILSERKLNKVLEKMNSIVKGSINRSNDFFGSEVYMEEGMKEPLRISNLSAGLKTFVILKKLIDNGSLNHNTILILDEPEIHLHPEWQLVYAELIVLLNLEIGLKILLTTHSPYFLNAIEVYSKKHKVNDINYYLSQVKDGSNVAEFKESNDNLEEIHNLLSRPFQKLEDINCGE